MVTLKNSLRVGMRSHVWDEAGQLRPLVPAPPVDEKADVAAIIVNRNRADLTDALVGQLQSMAENLRMDVFVVEMGSEGDGISRHGSFHYADADFRGKCFGHNVGLRVARATAKYRYYWILMNDLVFEDGVDAVGELVRIAEANPDIAIISPTETAGACPWGKPVPGRTHRTVPTCDYLCLLVRAEAVEKVGFLNPDFKYCWGAIHELAYKLYTRDWRVAYCDKVTVRHLGGTTYGKAAKTASRAEYQKKAKAFAARYFVEHYGTDWDDVFTRALPEELNWFSFRNTRGQWEAGDVQPPARRNLLRRLVRRARREVKRLLRVARALSRSGRLRRQIDSLNPWYYNVSIGGLEVVPGIGSKQSAEELINRVAYRSRLLVDRVQQKYDVEGKRILDIASNCAYWSARYAERGARSLLAVEGRIDYVRQGLLYWDNNRFMPRGAYRFLHGNVMAHDTWDQIRLEAPFDFTLCCGILYHVPAYRRLIEDIASVTTEAILIDSRVSDSGEKLIEEPGGHCFDAIVETRVKLRPNVDSLFEVLRRVGFEPLSLGSAGPVPVGLRGADDYEAGNRIALLALRKEKAGRA
ncbi:MAG: hypothetical protein JXR37_25745 [Kiritimatiellae bacterium]|nr:hypothetical protein [Kiritimatiellia bacterium]